MQRIVVFLLLSLPLVGAYAIFSLGLVVIHRASKVLNLAHGAMAMIPAYAVHETARRGLPIGLCVLFGVVVGAVLGVAVERVFVRPLSSVSPTAQTVGTVAALGLLVSVAGKIWGTGGQAAPSVFPAGQIEVGGSGLRYGDIGLFVVMIVVAGGLFLLLHRTGAGLAMRGAADNPRAASLMGVDPDVATSAAWAIAGATAAIAGILLAAVTTLHPVVLSLQAVPALVAALIGGLGSLPGALVGAAVVGAAQGLVPAVPALQRIEGSAQLVLTVLAMVIMALRGERYVATNVRSAVPTGATTGRRLSGRAVAVCLLALLVFPWLPFVSYSVLGSANLAAYYALVAVSLVIITGWVGQISLGHAGLVGVGAYVTGHVVSAWHVTFPVNLLWAALAGAGVAALLGVVAVRVRGLYLAVATLIFSWTAVEFLFRQPWFVAGGTTELTAFGEPGTFPYFDFSSRRTFFYAAWAVVATAVLLASNLRDSKTGRAFVAVRGSEVAAASLGINVQATKLVAFALSGALAGVAGNLLLVRDQVVSPDGFRVEVSLFFLAIAVVGGLSSLGGAIAAAIVFAALNEAFFRIDALSGWLEVVPPLLLTLVLLLYRGGLAAAPASVAKLLRSARVQRVARLVQGSRFWDAMAAALVRERQRPWVRRAAVVVLRARGKGVEEVDETAELDDVAADGPVLGELPAPVPAVVAAARPVRRDTGRTEAPVLVDVAGVRVQFGGLVAVDDVSLEVREHEIVGLIGPNGAGKTTTFNAIAGLNQPSAGTVSMLGHDVTDWPVDRRARLGVSRTFQAIQLVADLTVYDNLLLATHVANRSRLLSHALVGPRTVAAERAAAAAVDEVVEQFDLGGIVSQRVVDLPFGLLRMVELARALVSKPSVIMLDEPASGLDNVETDRLEELLLQVRSWGVTLLLIEHDVKLVTSVSDYMYVLDQGRLLAHGAPREIQRHPDVIAAYLGRPPEDHAPEQRVAEQQPVPA